MKMNYVLSAVTFVIGLSLNAQNGVHITLTGNNTLTSAPLSNSNNGIGLHTLRFTNNGKDNQAFGTLAMYKNTAGSYNNIIGRSAMYNNTSGSHNNALGQATLNQNISGDGNTAIGSFALNKNTSGGYNQAIGYGALSLNTEGKGNNAIGYYALGNNINGEHNVTNGYISLYTNTSGSNNIALGYKSLYSNSIGNSNVGVGYEAGYSSTGDKNVFIGYQAGYSETGNNKLHIGNNSIESLVYGEFDNKIMKLNAKVGIGANFGDHFLSTAAGVDVSDYNLFVKGGILTGELRLIAYNWADYVFEKNYRLMSLKEVDAFIKENGHLPNTPTAEEVASNGLSVSKMTTLQQEKIEELTLYTIEQDRQIQNQQKQLDKQAQEIEALKLLVQSLIK